MNNSECLNNRAEIDTSALSQKLTRFMNEHNITQNYLSEILNIDAKIISDLMRKPPRWCNIISATRRLHIVKINEFMEGIHLEPIENDEPIVFDTQPRKEHSKDKEASDNQLRDSQSIVSREKTLDGKNVFYFF